MPDVEERLAATRSHLLDDIQAPDLGLIARRAAALRRRRRAGRAGAALLALVAAGALVSQPWAGGTTRPTPATTSDPTPAQGTVYTDAGITLNGIYETVTDLPGELRDVEFVDPDRGWALAADCPEAAATCRLTVAGTTDGGLTWAVGLTMSNGTGPRAVPDLVVLDAATLVLHGGGNSMISTDAGTTWRPVIQGGDGSGILGRSARPLLRPGTGAGCAGAVVEVWTPGYGYRGDVATPPPLDVCWVAARESADGGWWVGGTVRGTGKAAVAVTRDGGVRWYLTVFDIPGDAARVATLGNHTYAAVLARDGQATALRAIFHSASGGPFARTWQAGGEPRTIGGEPVPLLDGRLLVVHGPDQWFVSDTAGLTFIRLDELPRVSRLWRTPAGYVALDVVADGWAAFSSDGSTWRKLHVH